MIQKNMASKRKVKCVLHLKGSTSTSKSGNIKLFDKNTWEKVKNVQHLRQLHQKNSKYVRDIDIPSSFDDSIGYHVGCYSAYTSYSRNNVPMIEGDVNVKKADESKSANQTLRSASIPIIASTSGIFERECIICRKVRPGYL